ncbi:hypothetical protein HIM_02117 [Hirsutella minnesotensis 3608]|nr:hypothetical protein HIM_02117 [Hirsutella minnesotensis 3608]
MALGLLCPRHKEQIVPGDLDLAVHAAQQSKALTRQKVLKRLEAHDSLERDDFFAGLLRAGDASEDYLMAEAVFLNIAGGETTAVGLAAALYYLDAHPFYRERLVREIRGSFASYDEISNVTASKLPFLQAVIDETLRMFPPVPSSLPRVSPGAVIDGDYIPEGVVVGSHMLSTSHNPETVSVARAVPTRTLAGAVDPPEQAWPSASHCFQPGHISVSGNHAGLSRDAHHPGKASLFL